MRGSPLLLKFKPNCVNSVSAPNGVGKSSIYEALSFALTGGIPNSTSFYRPNGDRTTI